MDMRTAMMKDQLAGGKVSLWDERGASPVAGNT